MLLLFQKNCILRCDKRCKNADTAFDIRHNDRWLLEWTAVRVFGIIDTVEKIEIFFAQREKRYDCRIAAFVTEARADCHPIVGGCLVRKPSVRPSPSRCVWLGAASIDEAAIVVCLRWVVFDGRQECGGGVRFVPQCP